MTWDILSAVVIALPFAIFYAYVWGRDAGWSARDDWYEEHGW